MTKKIFLFFLIFSCFLIIGCSCETNISESKNVTKVSGKGTGLPQTHTILLENNQFKPTKLDIKIGDSIIWINKDSNQHTITFEDARLNKILNKGETISYTFKEEEEARYFCRFHSGMQGSIKIT